MAIIILIVIIYMAVMIGIGVYGSRKKAATESMSNFLTAGRNGGLFVLVCTYIGSHVGNGIIVGGAQYGADYGIAACGTAWVPCCPTSCSAWSCPVSCIEGAISPSPT